MDNAIVKSNGNGKQGLSLLQQVEAQIAEYTPILREMIVGGKKLNDEQIKGRVMFATSQGLDPITEVHTLVDGNGRTMGQMMAISAYRRKCQEQAGAGVEILLDFIEMTNEQLARFPGALIGYECRLREGGSYTQWQRRVTEIGKSFRDAGVTVTFQDLMTVVGPPPVFSGIGLVYKTELNEFKDRNFNPLERAKKRAEHNARSHRFPVNAPVFEDETAGGMVVDGQTGEIISEPPAPKAKRTEDAIMTSLGFGSIGEAKAELKQDQVQEGQFRAADPEPTQAAVTIREDRATMDEDTDTELPMYESDEEAMADGEPQIPPLRFQPDILVLKLAETAEKKSAVTYAEKQRNTRRGLIATVLETALNFTPDPKASRKQLMAYLVKHDSLTDLDDPTLEALYLWLKPTQDSGQAWIADDMAVREAVAAFNACQPSQDALFK